MRILVLSLPRTCSSVTTNLLAKKFNLLNLYEVYSARPQLHIDAPPINYLTNADFMFAQRANLKTPQYSLPVSLIKEDNYCGKILSSVFVSNRISYKDFDWNVIDKIIFTTRNNKADQIASWLVLDALYFDNPNRTSDERIDLHRNFKCNINLTRFPDILTNFTIFNEMKKDITSRFSEKCYTITYEMFQTLNAATQISNALNCTITENDLQNVDIKETEKNYKQDVLNYELLQTLIEKNKHML